MIKRLLLVGLSALIGIGSWFLGKCGVSSECDFYALLAPLSFPLFEPLLLYSLVFTPVALIFVFVSKDIYSAWKKFTLWWLILSAIVILATPTSSNTWMPLYSLEREGVTWIMGTLFALISLGIIVWKSAKK